MQPVTLPTDNLYKFQAIAGIILIGAGVSIPLLIVTFGFERLDELNRSVSQIEAALEHEEAISEIEIERFEFLTDLYNSIPSNELTVSEKIELKDAIFNTRTRLRNQMSERRRAISRLSVESQSQNRYTAITLFALVIGILTTVMGYVLTKRGFHLWHSRLQVHLDEDVKYRASLHKNVGYENENPSRNETNGDS